MENNIFTENKSLKLVIEHPIETALGAEIDTEISCDITYSKELHHGLVLNKIRKFINEFLEEGLQVAKFNNKMKVVFRKNGIIELIRGKSLEKEDSNGMENSMDWVVDTKLKQDVAAEIIKGNLSVDEVCQKYNVSRKQALTWAEVVYKSIYDPETWGTIKIYLENRLNENGDIPNVG